MKITLKDQKMGADAPLPHLWYEPPPRRAPRGGLNFRFSRNR